jgi:hypothetical protein
MDFTSNFALKEFTSSTTASEQGITNNPDPEHIQNLRLLTHHILEPIRRFYRRPVIITSGYRCPKLNEAVGGVDDSWHTYGLAADFHVKGVEPSNVYQSTNQTKLPYQELILYDQQHVHVALDRENVKM